MAKLLVASVFGVVIGVGLGAALGLHAQEDEDTVALAAEAGVDPTDLQGALNSQPWLDARTYLRGIGLLTTAPLAGGGSLAGGPPPGSTARVRLTYYTLTGRTASGGHPYMGSTACSWNWPMGTRFVFRDGETVTCTDRGMLGASGWLDLWNNAGLVRKYGSFATVGVLP